MKNQEKKEPMNRPKKIKLRKIYASKHLYEAKSIHLGSSGSEILNTAKESIRKEFI